MALDGDTLAVGAFAEAGAAGAGPDDNMAAGAGAVYVYVRSGGMWTEQARLKASNAEGDDRFGWSVALSGDTILVGAYQEDAAAAGGLADNSAPDAGAAYVFTRSGAAWTQQARLKAGNADAGDHFGWSVALDGDTALVGAPQESSSLLGGSADNSAGQAGAAYVFVRSGGIWTAQALLKASNAGGSDQFGYAVALDGDTAAVGAPIEASDVAGGPASNGADAAGAAYVFGRMGMGWSEEALLKAGNAEGGDEFGTSLALSGTTLVVGAPFESSSPGAGAADNSLGSSGAAYVYVRGMTGWVAQAFLKAANAGGGDQFGRAVALHADHLAVGAFSEDSAGGAGGADNSAGESGAVYVFLRAAGSWYAETYTKASNAGAGDNFGRSVALSGTSLAVGAFLEDGTRLSGGADDSAGESGAAYLLR